MRNSGAEVLRAKQRGERIIVTRGGVPLAEKGAPTVMIATGVFVDIICVPLLFLAVFGIGSLIGLHL